MNRGQEPLPSRPLSRVAACVVKGLIAGWASAALLALAAWIGFGELLDTAPTAPPLHALWNVVISVAVLSVAGAIGVAAGRRHWRRTMFVAGPPRCATCGYQLTGLDRPRCPECGTPFDENLIKSGGNE